MIDLKCKKESEKNTSISSIIRNGYCGFADLRYGEETGSVLPH